MMLDGKAIASELLQDIRKRIEPLGRIPQVRAITVSPNPATESYLRIKTGRAKEAGMRLEVVRLSADTTEAALTLAATGEGVDAVIVQLPLPEAVNGSAVLDAIPLAKDADVLSSLAYERFLHGEPGALLPPVVCAVAEILARAGVTLAGKHAAVVGNGRLVGAPVRAWLLREGADVSVLTQETFEKRKHLLKEAEIIVSGAGSPHLIAPSMLGKGAVLIDAGTSESNGAIVGDFDPDCADTASLFTPVPGGVGPVAVSCLFKNVASLLNCP